MTFLRLSAPAAGRFRAACRHALDRGAGRDQPRRISRLSAMLLFRPMKSSRLVSALGHAFASGPAVLVCALGGLAAAAQAQTTVFHDAFDTTAAVSSSINSTGPTPAVPSLHATAYQQVATKVYSPAPPTVSAGHLKFGIVSTSSGASQIQALFSKYPVTLTNVGDYIELTVVFTNQAGLFNATANNALMLGLFNGGQQQPYPGGQANSTLALTGGVEGWQGYGARVYVSGSSGNSNALLTRNAQTTSATSNQDLLYNYSGVSTTYAGTTSNTVQPAALTVGNQYTETLRLTKAGATTLTILHRLHAGEGTSGTELFTQSTTTSSILTAVFDGLAVGYRAAGAATTMDVTSISVVTTGAVLVVPAITTQPLSQTKSVGEDVTLGVVADGGAGTVLEYQWRKGGVDIPGATGASLTLSSLTLGDAGDYTVVVTDAAGSTTSAVAQLTVTAGAVAPQILTAPAGATILVGGSTTFTVLASGTEPMTYQWQRSADGVAAYADVAGATGASLALANAALADAGYYQVVIANAQGSVTSTPVLLTVNQAPAIVTQPVGATLAVGAPLTLTVAATGSPAPSYQWYRNGVALSGATGSTYAVASVTGADTGAYSVVVSNSVGSAVTSTTVSVAVLSTSMAVTATTPAVGAASALPDTRLTLTFNTAPTPGTGGAIRIYDASNDTVVDTIDLVAAGLLKNTLRTASALSTLDLPVATKSIGGVANWNYYPLTVSGNTVTIHPRNGVLAYGRSYYVQIDPGAFLDATGLSFAGIADKTTWTFSTTATTPASATDLTVAADGSGDFCTVQAAIDSVPAANTTPTRILIKNGTYFEIVYFTAKHNLTIRGEDAALTRIVYPTNNNFNGSGPAYHRGTFFANGVHDVVIANLTIQNSTPQGGTQAEALILSGTATAGQNIVTRCALYSYQDTLQINGQAYVSDTRIEGDVDFLWGTGPCYFTNCTLKMLRASGGYFAQIRNPATNHGYIFNNCRFIAVAGSTANFLNRIDPNSAQFPYCEVVLLDCRIGDETNNAFLATAVGNSGSNYANGWWLLNNATASTQETLAANVRNWDHGTTDATGAALDYSGRVTFTTWTPDSTALANYADPAWVLGTTVAGAATASTWTPALAPVIVGQPAAASVDAGSAASFSVVVTAVPAATYQWKKDGADIPGATSATYAIASAAVGDAGGYSVVVTNSAGSVTSATATLTVDVPAAAPAITTQPQSQTVDASSSATFTVVATGTAPLGYQWKKDGADLSGATSDTLTLSSVQAGDAGGYTVTVSNTAGSVTSDAATLTVRPVVTIPAAPVATSATAVGTSGFTANWDASTGATGYRLDVSTSSTFASYVTGWQDLDVGAGLSKAVTGLSGGTTYYYRVRATNTAGASDSSNAITVATVARTNISIEATGTTTATTYSLSGGAYTQTFDTLPSAAPFSWANDSTLPGWSVLNTAGTFNATGAVVDGSSNMADLTLGSVGTSGSSDRALAYHTRLDTAPTYIGLGFTNNSGQALTSFSLSYTAEQWRESTNQRNMTFTVQYRVGVTVSDLNATTGWTTLTGLAFTSLNGSATATAALSATAVPVSVPAGSTLWFRWVTANSATSSTSSNDLIAVDNVSVSLSAALPGAPAIATQPAALTVNVGESAAFGVTATGDAPLAYQWKKDGSDLAGATASTFTIAEVQEIDAGAYAVVVSNGAGSVTSDPAVLTVTNHVIAPAIASQPQSQTVDAGATAVFTVTATGTAPLAYQWRRNGTPLDGEISDTLTLLNVQAADAGVYTVVVTNSAGSVTSAAAVLSLTGTVTAPVIVAQSGSQSVVVGGTVAFSVDAAGSEPFTYQWFKDGNPVAGATAWSLTLTGVQPAAAGAYTVVVTNAAGSATSEAAILTVTEPPAVAEGTLFVAPDGLASNPGTYAQPTTLAHAIALVSTGGTIYVRGGTYVSSTELRIERGNNGASGLLKRIFAYTPPGGTMEKPVLDFSSQPYGSTSSVSNPRGLWIGGNYWHIKGLEVKGAADNGIFVAGNSNIVELCVTHHNRDSGLQIARYASSAPPSEWPSYNLILNCESYDNDDVAPNSGENADGFACKLTSGPGNVFRGCISHNNIDDGWDLYTKSETGAIDPVVIDQCIAYGNGTLTDGTQNAAGDKNGFKLGGEKIAVAHYVSRSISFGNGKNGFTWNSNPGAIRLVNNLAFDNVEGNYKFDSGEATFYNNVSLWTTSSGPGDRKGVNDRYVGNSGIATGATNCFWFVGSSSRGPSINDAGLTAYKTGFISLTVPAGGFARKTDGSIALGDFGRPVAGSTLINAGALPPSDVLAVLPYVAASYYEDAPDIGAVETYLHTAPLILSAPQGRSVATGMAVSFAVSVQGTEPFAYQWFKDGAPIAGATDSVFAIASTLASDSGSYTVTITNSAGSTTSDPAVLVVAAPQAPSITTPPASRTVNVGTETTFTVDVAGTAPFTYQWSRDGAPIGGATGASYTIASVQVADAGSYTVTVTNSLGSATSAAAILTVDASAIAPTITTQPVGATKIVGSSHTFTVAAGGSQPFTYQWKKDGSDLAGATAATLALTDIAASDAGSYTVVVANGAGSVTSSAAVLVVTAAPDTVYLSDAFADGTRGGQSLPSSAAWWTSSGASNFTATTGAATQVVSSARTILAYFTGSAATPVTLGVNQKLTVECVLQFSGFDSAAGTSVSNFRIGLLRSPDDTKRVSTDFGSGQPATGEFTNYTGYAAFAVANAAGDPVPVSFGARDQANLGLLNTTLAFTTLANGTPAASAAMTAGTDYRVTFVVTRTAAGDVLYGRIVRASDDAVVFEHTVTDAASTFNTFDTVALYFGKNGSSSSYNVILKSASVALGNLAVLTAPVITTQPASQSVGAGSTATFTVAATGTAPLAYQWKKDGTAINGATASTLTLADVQAADAGSYTVVVTNTLGSATSDAAVLTVTTAVAPSITTQPSSQSATVGDSVSLSVAASGSAPLGYQWKKGGSDVAGATSSTLAFASVQLADAGSYTVVVSNSAGTVTSDAAVLTVSEPPAVAPTITTQPQSQTVTLNGSATFTVVATGTAPLAYQWKKDGAAISGATTAALALTNVTAADVASYTVVVTNGAGSVTSEAATLSLSSSLPVTSFNLTGFATVGSGTTGGGEIPDTDAAYRKVTTPLEFVQAIIDSNKTAGKVKVIEIMNDLNLGWNEVGSTVQNLSSNPLRSHATPKLHPVLIQTGVSLLDIKAKSPLTIFSANGATIKHVTFNIKGTSNIVVRNLRFDEMWEWDESSKGDYDSNDWDFIDIANGGDVANVWIDHCTFTKAYDGIVDIKAGGTNVTISWCKYVGDDGATNPDSFVRQQLAVLEANRSSYSFYNFLRTNGFSVDEIAQIIQGHDKGHLMGANSLKTENDTLTATFHHLWMKNVWDRAVPRLRGGNVHDYNLFVDDTEALVAKRLRDTRAAALSTALRNTLNNTYSFNPPLNGAISTEGGSVLVEKSYYKDCLWPLRNNQTDPSTATYTGKIKAVDSIYSFLNTDSSTTYVRGDSTDAGNPMGPFQATVIPFAWDLTGGVLPYTYTPDDPAQLPAILEAGAGAGVVTWARANWLKTAYIADTAVAPSIASQPQAQSVATGADATFTVQATGSGTLTYQWKKNGSALADGGRVSGATTAVLTIASVTTDDAGNYSVLVTNSAGSVASSAAALTVVTATAPVIVTQPQSQSGPVGGQLQLKVVASGTGPFTYQWKRDGLDLVGATGDTLDFLSLSTSDAGSYTVVVTNTAGTAVSTAAVVTVETAPAAPVATAATAVAADGFTANWSSVSAATGYRLDVATDSAFGSFVTGFQDLDVGAALTAAVTGLSANTTYYYRVRAVNDLGASASSNVVPVTTALAVSGPESTVILHETLPLDTPATQPIANVNANLSADANSYLIPVQGASGRAAWYSGGTGNINYVQATSMGLSASTSARGLLGYIAPSGSLVSLAAGETLTATLKFKYTYDPSAGTPQTGLPNRTPTQLSGDFRVGLLNSNGNGTTINVTGATNAQNPARLTAQNFSVTNAAAARGYSGYFVNTNVSASAPPADSISFWARTQATYANTGATAPAGYSSGSGQWVGPSSSDLAATSTFVLVGSAGGGTVGALPPDGTEYTLVFSVKRVSDSEMTLAVVVRHGDTIVQSHSVAQTSGTSYRDFDTFVIFSNLFASLTVTGFDLAKTAEPAAVAPAITVQPAGRTVVVGDSVVLSVAASGTAPLTYQWKKDGTAVSGATSSSLTFASAQESDAGSYTVVVSNSAGSVTSDAAVLAVDTPPAIATQPQSQSHVAGTDVTFTVVATGTAPLTYQWKHDDVAISGATAATLTLASVQEADAGSYTVTVSNPVGSVTSEAATLTVTVAAQAPSIVTQPLGRSATLGDDVTFTVVATGTAPLTYQWSKDGSPISGATSAALSLANVQPADAGTYAVTVTNSVSSVTSSGAVLTVAIPSPVISVQPVNQSALIGSRVNFSVAATGYGLTYQWARNGAPISGATGPLLQLAGLASGDAASYSVTVTNAGGSVASSAAVLTLVEPAAALPTQPVIPAGVFRVTDYGAVGDGVTDNTAAIQAAINAAQTAGGGTIEIPAASGAYLSSSLTLRSNMNLQIDAGAILQVQAYGTYANANAHFITVASGSSNVAITGSGIIEGNGSAWWTAYDANSGTARPRLVQITRTTNLLISGLTVRNSPQFHLAVATTNNATIYGVTITAPESSPNTDGIDPSGTNFLIQGCAISVGDDNIAVKAGDLCSAITVADCTFGTGHGLSVGGQSTAGLDGLNVMRCTFNGTSTGLRLKADATQGGPVKNLTYTDITMTNVPYPIVFYSYYNQLGSPGAASGSSRTTPEEVVAWNAAPPNPLSASTIPTWKNITVRNLTATGATGYSILWGIPLADALIANVTFDNVKITGGAGLELYNATNVQLVNGTSFGGTTYTANALGLTGQPQDAIVNAGEGASFTVTAVGTSGVDNTAPAYQWKRNGVALVDGTQASGATVAGATAATLNLTNLAGADAGQYTCTVSNALDGYNTTTSTIAPGTLPVSATSAVAVLTVNGAVLQPPEIVTQPVGQTVGEGATVAFSVTAYSSETPTYQWKHNDTAIAGATSATLTLTGVTAADAGDYTVTVTNTAGSVTSTAATLTVNVTPAHVLPVIADAFTATEKNGGLTTDANGFLAPTATQAVWFGGGAVPTYNYGASITMSAGNRGLLAYFTPSTSLASLDVGEALVATVAFKYTAGTGAATAGNFRMAFLNSGGHGGPTNDGASAAPRPDGEALPAARIAVDNFSLTSGGNTPRGYSGYIANATAGMTSTDSISFWRRDGGQGKSQQWAGPTSSDLAASGTFSQVVAPGGGSAAAILNAGASYVATYLVERVSATETLLTYKVTTDNGATTVMSYSGTETSATPITGFDTFFILSTYNASLAVTDFAIAKIAAPPAIEVAPVSQTLAVGVDAAFSVTASGSSPLAYQWSKDGVALADGGRISGAATARLAIAGTVAGDAGDYTVTVTNAYGTVTSTAATLTMSVTPVAPTITWSDPAAIAYGTALGDAQLNATASVPGTFVYTPAAGAVLNAGADQALGVTFTPTDAVHYTTATATVHLTVKKAAATIELGGLAATYDGTAKAVTATTTPAGLNVSLTYDSAGTAPTAAGSYAVAATIDEANYSGSATGTLVIAKAAATIELGGLAATYDGTAKTVTATTTPAGLNVSLTYDGAGTAPTNAGSYPVVATIADANRAGSATGTLVIAKATQTITFNPVPGATYGAIPFAVSASASSGLPVSFSIVSGPATIDGATVTITGTGPVVVRASQSGDANHEAATAVDQSFTVGKANQAITFNALAGVTYGATPFTVSASASSGLPVTFSIASGPATIDGATVTITGAGTVVVRASQAGDDNHNPAPDVTQSFTVGRANQAIDFATVTGSKTYGDAPFTLSATAGSGLPVTFSVISGPATIAGSTVTLTGAGTIVLRASQAGDDNHNPAPNVDQSITVAKKALTITAGDATRLFGAENPAFDVSYDGFVAGDSAASLATPPTASTAATAASKVGTYPIAVTGAVSANYDFTYVAGTLTVTPASATVTLGGLEATYDGSPKAATAITVPAGLTVALTYDGASSAPSNAGSYAVVAAVSDENYTGGASGTLVIAQAGQTLTIASLPGPINVGVPFTVNATASSGLSPIAWAVVSGPATLVGNSVTVTGTEAVTLRATQTGDANYAPASAEVTFAAAKQNQTISFAALSDVTTAGGPIILSATASSGLPVVFTLVSGPATLSGGTLTLTGQTGTVIVRASQEGNDLYDAAPAVERSFAVTPAAVAPTITTQPSSKAVNAGEAVTFTVVATGTPAPTYQWKKDGTDIAGATSASFTLASAATTDAGAYTVVVTNSAGSVTSAAAALTVTVPDFAGIYFGEFASGGNWALYVRVDQTGTFIAYLPDRGSAIVLELSIQPDGSFTVTGSEIRPLAASARATARTVSAASTTTAQALTGGFTLSGRISNGGISGQVEGLGKTFTGTVAASSGSADAVAGIYTATSADASGSTYTIIGADGHAVVVAATPSLVTGGAGTVDARGELTVTTADAATITLTINADSQEIAASVLPEGETTPISFTGSSTSDAAPRITSPNRTTFTVGLTETFTVKASGTPAPTFSASGLPDWLKLDAGTGVLSGQAPAVDGAQFAFVITAANGKSPDATQAFTLSVKAFPTATTPLTVSAVAGKAQTSGSADGSGEGARFNHLTAVALDAAGNIYVADTDNHTIRKVTAAGAASTLAGAAGYAGSTDAIGAHARFNAPTGVAVDSSGNVYVADTLNHVIRKVTSSGEVSTFAGRAETSGTTDGASGAARFYGPQGLAIDATSLYVADTNNHTIRRIDLATGVVSTFAGVAGRSGSADGAAGVARFNAPAGVAVDSGGNLYVADTDNHTIRLVSAAGQVSTLAGLAGASGAADGKGTAARFNHPTALALGGATTLCVVDTDNHTIRKIVPTTGVVTTVAGAGHAYDPKSDKTLNGSGNAAVFNGPSGIVATAAGEFYLADTNDHLLRFGAFPGAPVITSQPQDVTVTVGSSAQFSVTATGYPAPTYQWLLDGEEIKGATSSTFSLSTVQTYHAGTYTVVVTNDAGSVTSSGAKLTVNAATSGSGSGSGGGGGGAAGAWFHLALALLVAARWIVRRRGAAAGS